MDHKHLMTYQERLVDFESKHKNKDNVWGVSDITREAIPSGQAQLQDLFEKCHELINRGLMDQWDREPKLSHNMSAKLQGCFDKLAAIRDELNTNKKFDLNDLRRMQRKVNDLEEKHRHNNVWGVKDITREAIPSGQAACTEVLEKCHSLLNWKLDQLEEGKAGGAENLLGDKAAEQQQQPLKSETGLRS